MLRSLTAPLARPCLIATREFKSRAHPTRKPEFKAKTALTQILEGIDERLKKREIRWDKFRAPQLKAKGIEVEGPYRNVDETIEFSANLNLDPRRPGQAIRGSITLPHGTGKKTSVVVFTNDEELAKKALEGGAAHAGGQSLIDEISAGTVNVGSFQRAYATSDIVPDLSKSLARVLGPRGLMPNKKNGTIFDTKNDETDAAKDLMNSLFQASSTIEFRADANGIVHVPVGKASFGSEKLMDNLRSVCEMLQEVKPESFGKGKKGTTAKAKNAKYWLRAHLASTQGKGVRLDLKNIDPTTPFFLQDDDMDEADETEEETAVAA